MILGMSLATFTTLHVIISLIGIAAGIVVAVAMLTGRQSGATTGIFLVTTILTSVTGFMFPFKAFGPPHAVGVISLVLLTVAVIALYLRRLSGRWRVIYIATALSSLYLNVFVGIVQAFQKLPPLQVLAPTQTEPPFLAAQTAALAVLIWLIVLSVRKFHPAPLAH